MSDSGDIIDPRLASALKIRRILNEIICKQDLLRRHDLDTEIYNLWYKAARIARSDCKVAQTTQLRYAVCVPGQNEVIRIRDELNLYINGRGAQLRRLRLQCLRIKDRNDMLKDPSHAFALIKPEEEPLLAALKRNDGTITSNIVEMDRILREKWGGDFLQTRRKQCASRSRTFLQGIRPIY